VGPRIAPGAVRLQARQGGARSEQLTSSGLPPMAPPAAIAAAATERRDDAFCSDQRLVELALVKRGSTHSFHRRSFFEADGANVNHLCSRLKPYFNTRSRFTAQ